jgi:hypothetical protein
MQYSIIRNNQVFGPYDLVPFNCMLMMVKYCYKTRSLQTMVKIYL